MIKRYRCKNDVIMKDNGQMAFVAGHIYDFIGMSERDMVFVNETGGKHLISRSFFKKHFDTNEVKNDPIRFTASPFQ